MTREKFRNPTSARRAAIPPDSLVNNYTPVDYTDCYALEVETQNRIDPDDIQVAFWRYRPAWIAFLFKLRNILVKPLGLDTGAGSTAKEYEQAVRSGGSCDRLEVRGKTEQETVVSLDDKHLTALLSVHIQPVSTGRQMISLSTSVQYKNRLGRVYFFFVRPFHAIVVKRSLEGVVGQFVK